MAIATYRGERNLGEITDKLYSRLTPLQREKAEAELLRANPQLSNIRKLPEGTILQVPEIPELRAKATRGLDNPDEQIAKELIEALSDYRGYLGEQFDAEKKSVKQQTDLLNSARFKKDISQSDQLAALAAEASKSLGARSRGLGPRKKAVDAAIQQSVKDLKKDFL